MAIRKLRNEAIEGIKEFKDSRIQGFKELERNEEIGEIQKFKDSKIWRGMKGLERFKDSRIGIYPYSKSLNKKLIHQLRESLNF